MNVTSEEATQKIETKAGQIRDVTDAMNYWSQSPDVRESERTEKMKRFIAMIDSLHYEIEMYLEQTDEIEGVTQWGSVVYADNREMVRVNEDVNETTSGVLIPEDLT